MMRHIINGISEIYFFKHIYKCMHTYKHAFFLYLHIFMFLKWIKLYFLFYLLFKDSTDIFPLLSIMLTYSIKINLQLEICSNWRKIIFKVVFYIMFSIYIVSFNCKTCQLFSWKCHLCCNFRRTSNVVFAEII